MFMASGESEQCEDHSAEGLVAAKQRNTLWYVCTRSKSSLTSLTGFSMIIRVLAFENDHVMEKLVLNVQGEMGLAWEKVQ